MHTLQCVESEDFLPNMNARGACVAGSIVLKCVTLRMVKTYKKRNIGTRNSENSIVFLILRWFSPVSTI